HRATRRESLAGGAYRACAGDNGLPRIRAGGPHAHHCGNERPVTRNGAHSALGPMQSWQADMDQAIDGRRREAFRETLMRKILPAAVLLVLTGCGEELTPEEQAMADARDVAMVEAANDVMPPLKIGRAH